MQRKTSKGSGSFLRTLQRGGSTRRSSQDTARSALGFIADGVHTVDGLIDRLGTNAGTVLRALRELEVEGLIEYADDDSRSVQLSDKGRQLAQRRKSLL